MPELTPKLLDREEGRGGNKWGRMQLVNLDERKVILYDLKIFIGLDIF